MSLVRRGVERRRVCVPVRSVRGFFSWLHGPPAAAPGLARETVASANAAQHLPVLLEETVRLWGALDPKAAGNPNDKTRFFIDATVGLGGHTRALLARDEHAHVLCVDRDPQVLAIAKSRLTEFQSRVVFYTGSYAEVDQAVLRQLGFPQHVAGVCMDLGVNSMQFDHGARGFSFQQDGPLDMRYNQTDDIKTLTAAQVLLQSSEVELAKLFQEFGEERNARAIAKAIVYDRDVGGVAFRTTTELRTCIERVARRNRASQKAGHRKQRRVHPATRCFQALRMFVNDELSHVERGVKQLLDVLDVEGRMVTIAFHSLEDRPIKRLFRELDVANPQRNHEQAAAEDDDEDVKNEKKSIYRTRRARTGVEDDNKFGTKRFRLVQRKAIQATQEERESNPRSRSARLRCIERIE